MTKESKGSKTDFKNRIALLLLLLVLVSIVYVSLFFSMFANNKQINIHGLITQQTASEFKKRITNVTGHVTIHIESHGGMVLSANKIIHYLEANNNHTCVVDSHAQSMAALIALSCKKLIITNRAELLFHLPRMYENGKIKIMTEQNFPKDFLYFKQDTVILDAILTKEEMGDLEIGKDVVIRGQDLKKRLKL